MTNDSLATSVYMKYRETHTRFLSFPLSHSLFKSSLSPAFRTMAHLTMNLNDPEQYHCTVSWYEPYT